MNIIANGYKIYTTENIDYESEEDLTISIYELDEDIINDITYNINQRGYVPVRIGIYAEYMLIIDKFEDLNNHYEQSGDMFQDVKIHIRKAAAMLPIINQEF